MLRMCGNKITWLGHATFLLSTQHGRTVLIDPWLAGNPSCPASFKTLPRVDIVCATHGHGDHIGDLLAIARDHDAHVVGVPEICRWAQSKGIKNVKPMGKGGTQRLGDFEITLVDARHSSSIQDNGSLICGGAAGGYVIRMPGGLSIYHAGDTCAFTDMKLIGELHTPDVACLPIGDVYTMGPREAALAIRLLRVGHVIPMHYGTFPALTGTPQNLKERTQDISGLQIHVLSPGESLE
jgi:L-ascorbate metabolism protein UlaG (beta-lactamase superfamily)